MMIRVLMFILLIFLPSFGTQNLQDIQNQAQEQRKTGKVYLNFQDADINLIVKFMSELTGKNIVLDPSVKGTLTISSAKPLTIPQAWELFVLSLSLQGYGVVEDKNIVRIVPMAQAVPLAQTKRPTNLGEVIIFLYTAENTQASQLQQAIQPLLSPFARLSVHTQSNTLIIVDIAKNVQKIRDILKALDAPQRALSVKVHNLKRARAETLFQSLQTLLGTLQQQIGSPVVGTFNKDSNSIVIIAREDIHPLIEEVIKTLDQSTIGVDERSFYVIPLKFISAEELSKSLQTLFGGITQQQQPVPPSPRQDVQPRETPLGITKQQQQPQPLQPIAVIQTQEGLRIGFDRGTNSVIAYATQREISGLKALIDTLDVRRKQVLIAASIVELSTSRALDVGIRWQALGTKGGGGFGVGSAQDLYSALLSGNFVLGFVNNVGRSITIGGTSLFFPDLALLLSLIEKGSGFNLISNPKVLTLDNQEANIKVGQVVPFASGVKFDVNGQPVVTYDYKEVGLNLGVTPTVSGDNLRLMIRLQVQEIVDFIRPQIGQLSYAVPVTSNRQVNSDVVVEKGQTVIIGGLVSTRALSSQEGIPGLKDVPLLGRLFRRDTQNEDKVSLFIFITPFVIEGPEELSRITQEHEKMAKELQKLLKRERNEKKPSEP
ncbi:MAG: type II secretion system secretin GspD [Aquificaceae bacterium]|nr:type II secretion system secretin GspD [Aquificaceae bacterium]MDW8237084.1 type II secretion system secretin GspD [Aquificaceae bacterium]